MPGLWVRASPGASVFLLSNLSNGGKNVTPRPGIEPGPSTWQAEILTTRLSRIVYDCCKQLCKDGARGSLCLHYWIFAQKKKPILRAGFEPATYGYLMLTTTVHRSTNWAIEGGVAKHCISQDHIFSCVQLSVVVVVHKVIFWSVYNYLLLLLSPRADASSCTS